MMDLSHKTLHLLHDGDSYEIVVDSHGSLREIWRYRNNQTYRPEFCQLALLDEILQDRIHDKLTRFVDESDGQTCT